MKVTLSFIADVNKYVQDHGLDPERAAVVLDAAGNNFSSTNGVIRWVPASTRNVWRDNVVFANKGSAEGVLKEFFHLYHDEAAHPGHKAVLINELTPQ